MVNDLDRIVLLVSEETGVPVVLIKAPGRGKQQITDARFMFCWLATRYTDYPLASIAQFINKDHTSVLHAVNTVIDEVLRYDFKREFAIKLETLAEEKLLLEPIIKKPRQHYA